MEHVRKLRDSELVESTVSKRDYSLVSGVSIGERTAPAKPITTEHNYYENYFKRPLDIALVLLGSIFVLPVLLIICVMIKIEGGSIFYSQARVGRNGREFKFWKFRSMVPNAEEALEKHLQACPGARQEWDLTQKLKNDPRITRMGSFLRKSSLDELPQLWNVLKGDMSLIGPRPMMPSQKILYPGRDYYNLRPGISGPWQVSERNNVSFAERAGFDTDYARNVSLKTDMNILLKTVGAVWRGSGC